MTSATKKMPILATFLPTRGIRRPNKIYQWNMTDVKGTWTFYTVTEWNNQNMIVSSKCSESVKQLLWSISGRYKVLNHPSYNFETLNQIFTIHFCWNLVETIWSRSKKCIKGKNEYHRCYSMTLNQFQRIIWMILFDIVWYCIVLSDMW